MTPFPEDDMAVKPRKKKTAARKAARKKTPAARRSARTPVRRKRQRQQPETLRLRSVTPSFTVDDLEKSIAFYTGALGFMVGERWTDGGQLLGVMLKAGSCELGLSQDDWAKGRDRQKGQGERIWLTTVMDVDALAARAKAAGARLTQEPTDEYGARNFGLDDPDGYHLTVSRES
jgi:uncharacterized glyoxalase superfamily protein PhnB